MNRLLHYSLKCNTISFNHYTSPGGRIYIQGEKPEVGQDIPKDNMHAREGGPSLQLLSQQYGFAVFH